MQRSRDGDMSGISLLFDRYNVALYNFFRKMGACREVSEDLTQDLFLRVIRYRHSFDSGCGSFKSWLYQMARNIFTDDFQMRQKAGRVISLTDNYEQDSTQVTHTFAGEMPVENLLHAFARLTPDARELIILSRYEGFKYSEIAKMKNSTEGAVKTQMCRAMKELKDVYSKVKNW
ncbi:RNA polymerase sigma factor [Haoranjiania flava]|uniref:RNA polymerase sigma factor n=1 Tax=Haoranjiania flava TaxID=1856322 RepID=A0AAE3INP2_9BACT|nr:RNA polymerase sigma factor [Haoranjiania flava]MCU7695259.1 RNA polymerase sigma factor [Haoranjiania flava]